MPFGHREGSPCGAAVVCDDRSQCGVGVELGCEEGATHRVHSVEVGY